MGTQFTKDMNVITNFLKDMDIIAALDDQPNDVGGLTAAELKAKFDEGGKAIQEYINETLIPEVLGLDATEDARQKAEDEREAAELKRVQNEELRERHETDRYEAELKRISAEQTRVQAETDRDLTESKRVDAEMDRIDAEETRISNEKEREDSERSRVAAENQRLMNETARGYEESARKNNEQGRVDAEAARVEAEKARVDETNGIVAQATAQAESAEQSAQSASGSASTAYNLAQQANSSRVSAESSAANAKSNASSAAQSMAMAASYESSAEKSAEEAKASEMNAKESEQAASGFRLDCYSSKTAAAASATASQSWAVGGTGTREDEDTNNAKYWAEVAQNAAGSGGGGGGTAGVTSFNGRTGAVKPQAGDYTAEQVKALSTAGGSLSGNLVMQGNKIQAVGYPQSSTDAANKGYVDGTVKTFKGRTGDVVPQSGDYTAEMVGALPSEVLMLTGFEPDPDSPDGFPMTAQLTDEQHEAAYKAFETGRPVLFDGIALLYPYSDASDAPIFKSPIEDGHLFEMSITSKLSIGPKTAKVYAKSSQISAFQIGNFENLDDEIPGGDNAYSAYMVSTPVTVKYDGSDWILHPESNKGNIYIFSNSKYRLTADTDADTITLSENEVYSMIGNLNMILDTINGEVV